jgi:diguanylate cyclase (GGDEF)-like protein
MHKILLIDKGSNSSFHTLRKSLTNKERLLVHAQNMKTGLSFLRSDNIDLMIIDSSFVSKINNSVQFRKQAADIPKMVLVRKDDGKQKPQRLRDRNTVLIYEPLQIKEVKYLMDTLLKNRSLENENNLMQSGLSASKTELSFFNDTNTILTSTSDLNKILNSMMEKVKKITDAGAWSLLFNDEPFFEIVRFRTSKKLRKFRFQKGVGIAGWILEKNTPLIINDVKKDKRYNKEVDKFSNLNIKSVICAPLKIKERVIGVLRLINKKGEDTFTDDDLNLLVNAASYAVMAIERAFLHEEIKNDDLTSLYNFRYLHQAIDMEIERAERYGSLFSLIFMDLDNFKEVNDKYGHLIGSRLLIETSLILKKNLRTIDVITRYGGDEFVMILPQTSNDGCFLVAERLRKTIEKNVFLKHEGHTIMLTASFGIASFPDIAKNREELIHLADKAMYRGKFSSKNIVFAAK